MHPLFIQQKYLSLLRFMGGSSRKDMNAQKITHLISNKSGGNKYRVSSRLAIVLPNYPIVLFNPIALNVHLPNHTPLPARLQSPVAYPS